MVSGQIPITRVSRSFSFEAAHQLPWHPGRCRRLHGHHYRLEVSTEGPLDERGVVVDFDELDELVTNAVIDRYDHQLLNDFFENPTAEVIAHAIWSELEVTGFRPVAIRLYETPETWVELQCPHQQRTEAADGR
jgi:6-pyruvoyltetrahydropterin/6-carboxytetrahydropterin synthase